MSYLIIIAGLIVAYRSVIKLAANPRVNSSGQAIESFIRNYKYIIFIITIIFPCVSFSQSSLHFLSKEAASKNLAITDEFISRLSKFDMSARMKTDKTVSKKTFLTFLANAPIDWRDSDKSKVIHAFDSIKAKLIELEISLPNKISIILTNGKEEGNAAYTRGDAIIFQRNKLLSDIELQQLMAHELFHIYTRNNPLIKNDLYKTIGFQSVKELDFPSALKDRKITNPDAPLNNYAIEVEHNAEKLWVVPILFSETDTYIPSKGREFFYYLKFKLLVLANDKGISIYNPEKPRILDVSQVKGYFEQIGRNTDYIIHPEEILADNFALMILCKKDIPSPEIVKKITAVFRQSSLRK